MTDSKINELAEKRDAAEKAARFSWTKETKALAIEAYKKAECKKRKNGRHCKGYWLYCSHASRHVDCSRCIR